MPYFEKHIEKHLKQNKNIILSAHGNTIRALGKKIFNISDKNINFLEKRKIIVKRHPFEDHYNYDSLELEFDDGLDILMTEKDMVKCKDFNNKKIWYVPVEVEFVESDMKWLSDIEELTRKA